MRRELEIELGGKRRRIVFDLNSMALLEEHTQGRIYTDYEEQFPMKMLRLVIWAGLRADEPDLSIEDVGALVSVEELPEVSKKIREAFEAVRDSVARPTQPAPADG